MGFKFEIAIRLRNAKPSPGAQPIVGIELHGGFHGGADNERSAMARVWKFTGRALFRETGRLLETDVAAKDKLDGSVSLADRAAQGRLLMTQSNKALPPSS